MNKLEQAFIRGFEKRANMFTDWFTQSNDAPMQPGAERAALDSLLSINEGQARYAIRHGTYAPDIQHLGYQGHLGDPGQLTNRDAFQANIDTQGNMPVAGYNTVVRKMIPADTSQHGTLAAAIPTRPDLPAHLWSYTTKDPTFPAMEAPTQRITNPAVVKKLRDLIATQQPLSEATVQGLSGSNTLHRFLLNNPTDADQYPLAPMKVTGPNWKHIGYTGAGIGGAGLLSYLIYKHLHPDQKKKE